MKLGVNILMMGVVLLFNAQIVKGAEAMIKEGSAVKFDYTLTVQGEVIDSSKERGPLEYVQGEGNIIKGLEKEMVGLKVGDEKMITVAPEEGYGIVDPNAFREVPRSLLPAELDIQQGMIIPLRNDQGQTLPAMVAEVKEDTLVLNFNHPLAGQELKFDIKVVSIE